MLDEHVIFLEASRIEEDAEPLARSKAPLGVLGFDALRPASEPRKFTALLKLLDRCCQGLSPWRASFHAELLLVNCAAP
jgi:hypothetical protein